MEKLSTCDLREKDVVNVCDGRNLGCVTDFIIDTCEGKITALIVPRVSGFLGLACKGDIIIPWCKIECIGADTILVKIPPEELLPPKEEKKKKKSFW